jgi:acetylornithine deacetylase/succinyl-diaminopimelate desuccinylase-like protein
MSLKNQTFIQLLQKYVGYPSISTDSRFAQEVENVQAFLVALFKENDFDMAYPVSIGDKNSGVIAKCIIDPKAETVLVYGHYDVQPVDNNGWKAGPFEVYEEDGRLYGRGIMDNKGQLAMHMATIFDLKKAGALKYNVAFFVEGGEEISSPGIVDFVDSHSDVLKCDYVLISDGELLSGEKPVIEASLRGCINFRLDFSTAPSDQHSGTYGGLLPSALDEMARLIPSITPNNIKGFMHNVEEPYGKIVQDLTSVTKDEVLEVTKVKELVRYRPWSHMPIQILIGFMPSITITGFSGGYVGEGSRNSVPSKAFANISIRTVTGMNTQRILRKIEEFFDVAVPKYVDWKMTVESTCEPVTIDTTSDIAKHAMALLEKSHGSCPTLKYVGGSIPVVSAFASVLQVPVLLIPLGNNDANMHGTNENLTLSAIEKGLKFSELFFSK